jgi:hypothetical protein
MHERERPPRRRLLQWGTRKWLAPRAVRVLVLQGEQRDSRYAGARWIASAGVIHVRSEASCCDVGANILAFWTF